MRQEKRGLDDVKVVEDACEFFKIFKGLIVDLILSSKERDESRNFFNSISAEDALKGLNTFKDGLIDRVGLKDFLDEITCVSSEPLTMELWEYIFSELQKKSRLIDDSETVRKIFSARGICKVRFKDTCADAERFFRKKGIRSYKLKKACQMILEVNTEFQSTEVKGDGSKSVLFTAMCSHFNFGEIRPFVEIYSLRSRGWRKVDNNLQYVITARSTSAFLNGACHWVATKRGYGHGVCDAIVSFSLGEEVFGEMEVPKCLVKKYQFVDVAVFDGSLLLVASFKFSGEGCFTVWMMKEYGVPGSWTKLFDIPDSESHLKWMRKLVAFRQSGKVLLAKLFGQLVFYDPKTEEIFDTKIRGNAHSFYLDTFVESLVLLNEANEFTELGASEDNGTSEILEEVASSSNSQIIIDEANGESKEEAQGESISTQ
ncbi:hypothetical protein GH714_002276 [Hevea brasiliensis]|uniref:F-box associated beta-propeller type 1 domain-containing protein n=1 Tax=Hevea brasiliensis TaxID=3981 RepID=A0A6A6KWV5_HEVBR|nr:hypothetical protein GH714_002276 [Hevea brasiliensis]